RPVDRVEGGDAALMGEHDARGEGTDLGAIGCRRRLAARVGGAPAAVGGSAACGERERARAEEGDRTPLRDNGSHQLHGGSLSADENASQLGGDGPGAGAARPDLAGCGAWAGAARPGPAGRGQAGAVGDGLMAATAGDIATACRYSPTPDTSSRRTAPGHPRTAPPRPTPARTERAPRGTGAHGTGPRTVGDGTGAGGARPGGAQLTPKAIIASATLRSLATSAPAGKSPWRPSCSADSRQHSWTPFMISVSRCPVRAKHHASRLAFCCTSSALVASPPAFAALPGP